MMLLLGFLLGLFVGAPVLILTLALCFSASQADDYLERIERP